MESNKLIMKYPGEDGKERQFLMDKENGVIAYKGYAKDFQPREFKMPSITGN